MAKLNESSVYYLSKCLAYLKHKKRIADDVGFINPAYVRYMQRHELFRDEDELLTVGYQMESALGHSKKIAEVICKDPDYILFESYADYVGVPAEAQDFYDEVHFFSLKWGLGPDPIDDKSVTGIMEKAKYKQYFHENTDEMGYVRCKHDNSILFMESVCEQGPLKPSDANIIMEAYDVNMDDLLKMEAYEYDVKTDAINSASQKDNGANSIHPIISSPTMSYIPPLPLGRKELQPTSIGGFGTEDFSENPQLFFSRDCHIPFGPRRSMEPNGCLQHPYGSILWWTPDISRHFEEATGTALRHVFRLKPDILTGIRQKVQGLFQEIFDFISEKNLTKGNTARMRATLNSARSTVFTLECADLPYKEIMLQFALLKRQCWEVLAWKAYLLALPEELMLDLDAEYPTADDSFMGCFTTDLRVVDFLARARVPVWLLRTPESIPGDIIIHRQVWTYERDHLSFMGEPSLDPSDRVFYRGNNPGDWLRVIQAIAPPGFKMAKDPTVARVSAAELEFIKKDRQQTTPPSNDLSGSLQTASPTDNSSGPTARITSGSMPEEGWCYGWRDTPGRPDPTAASGNTSVDQGKFHTLKDNRVPSPLPVWENALSAVDRRPRRVRSNPYYASSRSYFFPNAYLIIPDTESDAGLRGFVNIFIWLAVKAWWIQRVVSIQSSQQTIPKPKQWRDFFFSLTSTFLLQSYRPASGEIARRVGSNGRPLKKSKSEQNRKEKSNDVFQTVFPLQSADLTKPSSVAWLGGSKATSIDEMLKMNGQKFHPVFWELHELCFRRELQALDQSILSSIWEDAGEAAHRENLILKVFPSDGYLVSHIPTRSLTSSRLYKRLKFIEAFRMVVAGWDGPAAEELKGMSIGTFEPDGKFSVAPDVNASDVEWRVCYLYCQTYFDYFRRAPTIPLLLPE